MGCFNCPQDQDYRYYPATNYNNNSNYNRNNNYNQNYRNSNYTNSSYNSNYGNNSKYPVTKYGNNNNNGSDKQLTKADMDEIELIVSLLILEQVDFYLANADNLGRFVSHLMGYRCGGSTALRDSVFYGIIKLINTKVVMSKITDQIDHKFIHIVITDGEDTSSKITLNELSGLFLRMGLELGDLCKTFFIGISLDDDELKQLEQLALLGGDSCELINEDVDKMDDIFSRIALSLGIEVEYNVCKSNDGSKSVSVTDASWAMKLEHQKYCVLFTLDTSSSMSGQKWKKLCLSILLFCKKLNKTDLFACQLFSNDVRTLTL
mmetsp:Transcript_86676/g.106343  ORF Transcript_86676/g.106343 Transcript_86676/m.106343 type:complete len:320 (+) Transcript_86676:75-1034(+)